MWLPRGQTATVRDRHRRPGLVVLRARSAVSGAALFAMPLSKYFSGRDLSSSFRLREVLCGPRQATRTVNNAIVSLDHQCWTCSLDFCWKPGMMPIVRLQDTTQAGTSPQPSMQHATSSSETGPANRVSVPDPISINQAIGGVVPRRWPDQWEHAVTEV